MNPDGEPGPLPGQLVLPGMPDPGPEPGAGQAVLPGLDDLRDPGPADDPELAGVAAELTALDRDGSRMAAASRDALDMLLDGQHTGRYRWEQLHKTEKTHAGTLVEIALARSLRLADGTALDYTIAGTDVDCKFSHRMGGWMIPPEADGQLMLLVQASDEDGTWSAGLLRATAANLSPAGVVPTDTPGPSGSTATAPGWPRPSGVRWTCCWTASTPGGTAGTSCTRRRLSLIHI